MTSLYEKDFCEWSLAQASHLRNNEIDMLDFENLIEEIESLGRSDRSSLRSFLTRLIIHLLKMKYAIHQKGNSFSWDSSILDSRRRIKYLLKDSPSLKNFMKNIYHECYEDAIEGASLETSIRIEVFSKECPWTIEEILQEKK